MIHLLRMRMTATVHCPFCNDLLGLNDFVPGQGAICPCCRNRVTVEDLKRAAASASTATKQDSVVPRANGNNLVEVPAAKTNPLPDKEQPPRQDRADEEELEGEEESARGDSPLSRLLRQFDGVTLGAFVAGSVAFFLASIPSLSFLTRPLTGLGLLLGLVGCAVAVMRRPAVLWLPLTVSVLCLGSLFFVGPKQEKRAPPPPPLVAIPLGKGGMTPSLPIGDDDWVDASANAVRRNDLRVEVVAVRIGSREPTDSKKTVLTKDKRLIIELRVTFVGVLFQEVPLGHWSASPQSPSKHPPILSDNANHRYAQEPVVPTKRQSAAEDKAYLTPGRQLIDVLVFPVPPPEVKYLRLELPASVVGMKGHFRFQVPRGMIQGS